MVVWGSKSDCVIAENAVLSRGSQAAEQKGLVFKKLKLERIMSNQA